VTGLALPAELGALRLWGRNVEGVEQPAHGVIGEFPLRGVELLWVGEGQPAAKLIFVCHRQRPFPGG
jgi:hypothetical protein